MKQVTYPYIMAKVRIQARTSDVKEGEALPPPHAPHHSNSKNKHPGAIDILAKAWKKDGPLGWYQVRSFIPRLFSSHILQGMQSQITKAVLSQALLFWSKEQFEQWTLALIYLFARLR
jgi:hypothetical protein